MPNRIIKESIRTSKSVSQMTDFQFRLWVYLITYVDDFGRCPADPELLKGFCFPRRKRVAESDIRCALDALAGLGCVTLYKVDGEPYLCLPSWSQHQRIQTKHPKYPGPDEADPSTVDHGESRWPTVDDGESPPESNPIQSNPNYNPNPNRKCDTRTREEKKAFGQFGKVLLADKELEKLQTKYPTRWKEYVDRLDEYIASKGAHYSSHYATILAWMRKDGLTTGGTTTAAPSAYAKNAIDRMMQQENQLGSLGSFEMDALNRMMGSSDDDLPFTCGGEANE